jgi:hypothetical protein
MQETQRRGRDSNPRYLSVHTISNRAPSTTRSPLQGNGLAPAPQSAGNLHRELPKGKQLSRPRAMPGRGLGNRETLACRWCPVDMPMPWSRLVAPLVAFALLGAVGPRAAAQRLLPWSEHDCEHLSRPCVRRPQTKKEAEATAEWESTRSCANEADAVYDAATKFQRPKSGHLATVTASSLGGGSSETSVWMDGHVFVRRAGSLSDGGVLYSCSEASVRRLAAALARLHVSLGEHSGCSIAFCESYRSVRLGDGKNFVSIDASNVCLAVQPRLLNAEWQVRVLVNAYIERWLRTRGVCKPVPLPFGHHHRTPSASRGW